jgi:hypothetical protein
MRLSVPAVSVRNIGGTIYVTISEGGRCRVSRLRGGDVEDVVSMLGSPCVLLWGRGGEFLVSVGNSLILVMRVGPSLGVVLVIGFGMLWRVMVWFLFRSMVGRLRGFTSVRT